MCYDKEIATSQQTEGTEANRLVSSIRDTFGKRPGSSSLLRVFLEKLL